MSEENERPSTSSLFWAEWREGLKDLQNVALDPWHGQTATHEEPGTIANPTQAMVTQDVGTVHGFRGHDAMLDAAAAQGVQQAPPEPEIEIGD